jgi:bifunctional UDP-N-acetylglucosamine pyrophosphorylase/glucosamine-1-phosphate N-acetyltransferase
MSSLTAKTTALILAAGQGTRMKSALPKVLHPVAGRPMVALRRRSRPRAGCRRRGRGRGARPRARRGWPSKALRRSRAHALQAEQRGTGDAARAGLGAVRPTRRACARSTTATSRCSRARRCRAVSTALGDVRSRARAAHLLHRRPSGLRPHPARRRSGTSSASASTATCSPTRSAVREVNPGIYASSLAFLREAPSRRSRRTTRRGVLPHRHRRLAAAAGGGLGVPSSAR